jgi:hypothetical protein
MSTKELVVAVLQIVRFRAKSDVTDEEMLAVNERFQREVAPTLPGLERREATRNEDGDWMLVLRYADMDHATGGAARDTSPVALEFMSKIDMNSMSASFHSIVSE